MVEARHDLDQLDALLKHAASELMDTYPGFFPGLLEAYDSVARTLWHYSIRHAETEARVEIKTAILALVPTLI